MIVPRVSESRPLVPSGSVRFAPSSGFVSIPKPLQPHNPTKSDLHDPGTESKRERIAPQFLFYHPMTGFVIHPGHVFATAMLSPPLVFKPPASFISSSFPIIPSYGFNLPHMTLEHIPKTTEGPAEGPCHNGINTIVSVVYEACRRRDFGTGRRWFFCVIYSWACF